MDASATGEPPKPVRVGFLGTGFIASYHSKVLRHAGPLVVRAGCFDPDTSRAEAFAAASGHQVCATEEEVLDGCDAVYLCTWTSEHPRLAAMAAERRVHVYCEKPLATTLAHAEALAATVVGAGLVHQVGLTLRHSPAYRVARRLIADPAAGAVMAVVFRDDQFIPIQGHYGSTWRADRTKAGAGTMLEHSIHDVDMLRFLVGDVDSVSARQAHVHGHEGIEDVVVASLAFASGALGTLTSVWHDNLARPSLRRVEVFCERRFVTITGDDWFGPVAWTDADGTHGELEGEALVATLRSPTGPGGDAPAGVARRNVDGLGDLPDVDFVEAVAEGRSAFPGLDVAVEAHRIVDAVYRSAATAGSPATVGPAAEGA